MLERVPFKAANRTLKFQSSKQPSENKWLVLIGSKPVFGTDGEIPKYMLAKAVLTLNGHLYKLQVDRMYNPWFGDDTRYYPSKDAFKLVKKGSVYKLRGMFSDGAGGYEAEWQITNRAAVRTVLTSDDAFFF